MPINDTIGTYEGAMAAGFPGMIADTSGPKDVASRVIEGAAVAFGLAVGRGAGDGSATLGGDGFEGITVADKSREADEYAVQEVAGVIRKGAVWVEASTAVAAGDPVTFTAATGVIGAGLTGTIDNAQFETSGGVGDLVRVYLG